MRRLGRRGKSFGSLLFEEGVVLDIAGAIVIGVVVRTGGNGRAVSGSCSSDWAGESIWEGR